MARFRHVAIVGAALFCVACGTSLPTAPTGLASADPSSSSLSVAGSSAVSLARVSCTVDIGETGRPLPALHVLAAWINVSLGESDLSCGQVRSLAAKLQQTVAALDQPEQNFDNACGSSTALLAELEALIATGQFAQLTFPPPVPGAPTTVLGLAEETNEHFCVAARE